MISQLDVKNAFTVQPSVVGDHKVRERPVTEIGYFYFLIHSILRVYYLVVEGIVEYQ